MATRSSAHFKNECPAECRPRRWLKSASLAAGALLKKKAEFPPARARSLTLECKVKQRGRGSTATPRQTQRELAGKTALPIAPPSSGSAAVNIHSGCRRGGAHMKRRAARLQAQTRSIWRNVAPVLHCISFPPPLFLFVNYYFRRRVLQTLSHLLHQATVTNENSFSSLMIIMHVARVNYSF